MKYQNTGYRIPIYIFRRFHAASCANNLPDCWSSEFLQQVLYRHHRKYHNVSCIMYRHVPSLDLNIPFVYGSGSGSLHFHSQIYQFEPILWIPLAGLYLLSLTIYNLNAERPCTFFVGVRHLKFILYGKL